MKIAKLLLSIIIVISVIALCTSCELLENIGITEHVHEYGTDWKNDDNNHWRSCTSDGCQGTTEKTAHTWGEPSVVEAEIGKPGSRVYTCTVCNSTKNEVIPELEHTHTADTEWLSNTDTHWNLCIGDGCSAKLNTSTHVWDNGTVVTAASSGKEGQMRYLCVVCGHTRTEGIPALPAKMSEAEWKASFDIDNVRIDAIVDVGGLVTTTMFILIDGEYAIVTNDGESYYSTSETELSQINFSKSYGDFDHIGDNVYYASKTDIEGLEITDVTIVFVDGKIDSISYTLNVIGFDSSIAFTLSEWGNVTVEIPTLTEEEYVAMQNPGKFYSYSLDHTVYKANGSYISTYYVFDGDNYEVTYYVDDDFSESSGVVENAGLVFNGALDILRPKRAEEFVYDSAYNAFSYPDPDIFIKDNISYFGIVVEDGYLLSVYIEYKNGDYETYYFEYGELPDEYQVLTPEIYESILNDSNYYNYSYTYSYYEPETEYYMIWDYVIDGDIYVFSSISDDGYFTETRELENAGVNVNHFVLSTLGYLHANDFLYDDDSGEFVLLSLHKLDDATTEYFSITIEDGYLTSVYIQNSYGSVTTYIFYDYGTSDVNAQY